MILADGSEWVIPDGWEAATGEASGHCRSCKAKVFWLTNVKSSKRAPFNQDGVNHFVTCPDRDRWRKK
jgi:hypothetical protein